MKLVAIPLVALFVGFGVARQETPRSMAAAYDSLADSILAVKNTETEFVRTILVHHYAKAQDYTMKGDAEHAAAEMALFGNEGDNAIGGVRKRLLEGGHHHNAEGEAQGIFEEGYVLVTKKMKQEALALSATMRQAKSDADKKAAWDKFAALAKPVIGEG
jgi:hypothetical protein